jgi:hypothetical protein
LAQAVALSKNAHTRLYLLRNRSELPRLPIRVWWFADGLFVVRAQPEYADLLGTRVVRICGHHVAQVKRAVAPLYAGNPSWRDYISTYTMTSPSVLAGLRVCAPDATPTFTLMDRAGHRCERALDPLPLRRSAKPTEAWWDLTPLHPGVQGPWRNALPARASHLPLYLRNPTRPYWAQFLSEERLLYVQYNRAVLMRTETIEAFEDRVLGQFTEHRVTKLVIDLRFNTGGRLQIAQGLMQRLAAAAHEHGAQLYVITGPATFSAGVAHIAQLRQLGRATIVGEPPGEGMTFWSEGGNVILPNSRLTLRFSDKHHYYGRGMGRRSSPNTTVRLRADRVTPEIRVRVTSRDYFTGHDPVLDQILRPS